MQAQSQTMAKVETKGSHLAFEADVLAAREGLCHLVRGHPGLEHGNSGIHPLACLSVGVDLGRRGTAHGEGTVVAGAVASVGLDNIKIRLITWPNDAIGKVVRVRTAALAGD